MPGLVDRLRDRHQPSDPLRDRLRDTRRLIGEAETPEEQAAVWAEGVRLAGELAPGHLLGPRPDGLDIMRELEAVNPTAEKVAPRVFDRAGRLPADHPLVVKTRELLAAAGTDEDRQALLDRAAAAAVELAAAEADSRGVVRRELDLSLYDAVIAEAVPFGLDFGAVPEPVPGDDSPLQWAADEMAGAVSIEQIEAANRAMGPA